jgi:hypothetical protein
MKKRTFAMATALALCILAAAVPAYAQGPTVTANIPFEFMVGSQILPAGEYRIQSEPLGDDCVQLIRSLDGGTPAMVLTMALVEPKGQQVAPQLVFHKYGHTYFLSEVWAGGDRGRKLFKSRREKELARSEVRTEVAVLVHSSPVKP